MSKKKMATVRRKEDLRPFVHDSDGADFERVSSPEKVRPGKFFVGPKNVFTFHRKDSKRDINIIAAECATPGICVRFKKPAKNKKK